MYQSEVSEKGGEGFAKYEVHPDRATPHTVSEQLSCKTTSEKSILNRFATFGICIAFIFPTGTIGFIVRYKDISNLNII